MIVGVTKLNETNAVVDGLRDDLKALAPVFVAPAAAEKMLAQVAIDSAEADAQKEVVEAEVVSSRSRQLMRLWLTTRRRILTSQCPHLAMLLKP